MNKGMTLLEILIAVAVLAIALIGLCSTYLGTSTVSEATEEEVLAANAIREKLADIRAEAAEDFNLMITNYTTNDNLIKFNVGRAHGLTLKPIEGQTSVGRVILYLNESQVPAQFGGNGAGLDLNKDGAITNADLSGSPSSIVLVPVEVRADWKSKRGNVSMRRFLLLARR